jgi:glycosyltransferase involved in cell wall biosynthesis
VPFDVSCYHIDDEYSWSEVDSPISARESRLIAAVNQVFIHSPALLEKKGSINPCTTFVPNGVDYSAFATPVPEPADLVSIPRPRIGYTGYLKPQLDLRLLGGLAARHPTWSFVLVGARRPEIAAELAELARHPNVHLLGAKSVDELAAYPQHFDVCIMPYVADGYTKFIYPLKLHEYLASGRPTVGSRIRSLEDFANVVALATTADEWSAVITEALSPNERGSRRRAERQAVACRHDWDILVARIAQAISARLGPRDAQRFATLTEAGAVARERPAKSPA